MSAAPRMVFNGVWPTYLVRRRLPAFERPNAELAAYIAGQDAREADFTARFHEQNFFSSDRPAVRWLKDEVERTAAAFLQQLGVRRIPSWTIMAWYNVNRYGDHHAPHTHPRAYLSGTYYVQVPAPAAGVDDPRARPGCISFYDPRTAANMITAGTDPDASAVHVVQPGAGTLLMWPSPLQHAVHPNLSHEQRISISFNLSAKPGA